MISNNNKKDIIIITNNRSSVAAHLNTIRMINVKINTHTNSNRCKTRRMSSSTQWGCRNNKSMTWGYRNNKLMTWECLLVIRGWAITIMTITTIITILITIIITIIRIRINNSNKNTPAPQYTGSCRLFNIENKFP